MPTIITAGGASARGFGFGSGKASGGFTPVNHIYTVAGGGTEVIPTGARQIIIEIWGGGGSGQSAPLGIDGGGGGAGGYSRRTLSLISSNWGKTLVYAVPSGGFVPNGGGAASVSNSTYPPAVNMTANGGGAGSHVTPALGGTASGGDINTSGHAGTTDIAPGLATAGIVGSFGGGGLGGASGGGIGLPGGGGAVAFEYS